MGDIGSGQLQVYKPETEEWTPACVSRWDRDYAANAICNLLGYS